MDDDSSMVQFSGNFIGNFPEVVRIGNLAGDVLVDFQSIDGTAIGDLDYTPTSGTITFKANTRATTIPLVIVNDVIAEGNETFTYVLRNPRGARLGPDSQQTFIIQDNDFGGSDIQFTAPLVHGGRGPDGDAHRDPDRWPRHHCSSCSGRPAKERPRPAWTSARPPGL